MNRWIVAITVMLPTLIEIVDTSVVNVSLDHIRGSLSAGIDESTWTITSYLVSNAIIIPISGWLSRLFGRKLYLILSISIFTFSSFMCGSAWNLGSLIFFRVLQGAGGGGLQPLSQAILLETFPPYQHGIAMAIFGVGIMFGPTHRASSGRMDYGHLDLEVDLLHQCPHWIHFHPHDPLFIVNPPYMERIKMKIDTWGLCFMAVGLGCLQIVLDKGQREDWFSSRFIAWMGFIAISSLIIFIVVEFTRRTRLSI